MILSAAPAVSVILPVHNGAQHLATAVQSILRQTYRDFELLVIDDASSDGAPEELHRFSDSRLRIIAFDRRRGLIEALNFGLREAAGSLIARMDSDDVSLPHRLAAQVSFMSANPGVGICGTWVREFGDYDRTMRFPITSERIRARLFFGFAMAHPSLMIRRKIIEQYGIAYDERYRHVEDVDFLIKAAEVTALANLPRVLLLYRRHVRQVSSALHQEQAGTLALLLERQLRRMMTGVSSEETDFHVRLVTARLSEKELGRAEHWLLALDAANRRADRYQVDAFRHEIARVWYQASTHALDRDAGAWVRYWRSDLSSLRHLSPREHSRFFIKFLMTLLGRRRSNT